MSKRGFIGIIVVGILLTVLVLSIATTDFGETYDSPQMIPSVMNGHAGEEGDIMTDDGKLKENSLPFVVFEQYGFVLIPLAVLMFGAMVGGVVISKEEVEE
jgi:NADH:ubiquinone oxidoreductase subunit 6 (subunit J)